MNTILTALVLSATASGVLGDTNRYYLTDDFATHYGDTLPFTPEQIERAKHAPECRPAAQDPEGHWGPVTEGFQLSIRLQKASFTNGEPVTASVILRNVSGRLLRYFAAYANDPLLKIVLMRDRERVPSIDEQKSNAPPGKALRPILTGSMGSFQSPPGTQRKFLVRLDKLFELRTNGEYVVQAIRVVPSLDTKSEEEVASGKATFQIESPLPSPALRQCDSSSP
jgi:hypothetical protein